MKQHYNTKDNITYSNKKANFLYKIEEKFVAGIVLYGWEAVSLMNYSFNMDASYCNFNGKDFVLLGSNITPNRNFDKLGSKNVVPDRIRTLLLTKAELRKIRTKISQKGMTCIPLRLYRDKGYLWKLEIALASGKNNADKRNSIKEKDLKRYAEREY